MGFDPFSTVSTRRGFFDGIRATPFMNVLATPDPGMTLYVRKLKAEISKIETDHETHHYLFDKLFRASEAVRIQQKISHRDTLVEINRVHQMEIEQVKQNLRGGASYAEITLELAESRVVPEMEQYIKIAIETGKPLFEVIPPTILSHKLDYLTSGTSQSDTSSTTSSEHFCPP